MNSLKLIVGIIFFSVLNINAQTVFYSFTNGSMENKRNAADTLSWTFPDASSAFFTIDDRNGDSAKALALNGSSFESNYTMASNLKTNYSVTCWIKTNTQDSDDRTIINQFGGDAGGETDFGYRLYLENGKLKAKVRYVDYRWFTGNIYTSSQLFTVSSSSLVSDGEWHHIALVASMNATDVDYTLFIDGVQEGYGNPNASWTSEGNSKHMLPAIPFKIAKSNALNGEIYEDTLDDIRVYQYALTESAVQEDMNFTSRDEAMVFYVKQDAGGNNDGTSWTDAYVDLQDAFAALQVEGDQIWIANGVYSPGNLRKNLFEIKTPGVSVYGGFQGNETSVDERDLGSYQTILSGDVNVDDDSLTGNVDDVHLTKTDNNYTLMYLNQKNITLDGLVFEGGYSDTPPPNSNRNLEINLKRKGAAIYGDKFADSCVINQCVFRDNVSLQEGAVMFRFEDGARDVNTIRIENCQFYNNYSRYGSGLFIFSRDPNIAVHASVTGCLFYKNYASDIFQYSGFSGSSIAAMANDGAELHINIINNTFAHNYDVGTETDDKGTLVLREYASGGTMGIVKADIYNNIFHDNYLANEEINVQAVGLMNFDQNLLSEVNFFHNMASADTLSGKVQSGYYSAGNNYFSLDPVFADAENADYRLDELSPAINTGVDSILPVHYTFDLAGKSRLNGFVDMGAYEYHDILSSIDYTGSLELSIYPNPFSHYIYLDGEGEFYTTIYDVSGMAVMQSKMSIINVSSLPNGLYVFNIRNESGLEKTFKMIKAQ